MQLWPMRGVLRQNLPCDTCSSFCLATPSLLIEYACTWIRLILPASRTAPATHAVFAVLFGAPRCKPREGASLPPCTVNFKPVLTLSQGSGSSLDTHITTVCGRTQACRPVSYWPPRLYLLTGMAQLCEAASVTWPEKGADGHGPCGTYAAAAPRGLDAAAGYHLYRGAHLTNR